MKHVISIGGGIASTLMLPLWVLAHKGRKDVDLVMARIPNEDSDVWRLCQAVEDITGIPINYIGTGKDVWEVFHEVKFVGNSLVDPCSDRLKRRVVRDYITSNYQQGEAIVYVGIGAYELDRSLAIKKRWKQTGYDVDCPLMDYPEFTREYMTHFCKTMVGFVPKLYELGFEHNNCGGACIKAGHKQWARLLWYSRKGVLKTHEGIPTFEWWRDNEQKFREVNQKNVAVLRDYKNGGVPLTLVDFEKRIDEKWGSKLPDYPEIPEHLLEDLDTTSGCSFCDAMA